MTTSTAEAHLPVDSVWNRGFAAVYPPVIKLVEAGGVGAARRAVVGRASGRTLEIGRSRARVAVLTSAVTELTLTEPDVWMLRPGAPGGEDEPSGNR